MSAILAAKDFGVGYGEVPVVRAVTCVIAPGEIVALLGRNGMGKTTLMRGIVGLVPHRRGSLALAGKEIGAAPPETIALAGVGYVPAGRSIFGSLTVHENLTMCARAGADGSRAWTLARVLDLFPRLAERSTQGGHRLSGGEQQMLAIGRALMTNPRLLLIDEATEGLAPLVARSIWATLDAICASGVAALIVDRDVRRLGRIAGRALVLFKGDVVFAGTPAALMADEALMQRYVGL